MSMNNNDPSGRSFQRYCVTGMCNESDKLPFLMGYGEGRSSHDELIKEVKNFLLLLEAVEPIYISDLIAKLQTALKEE